MSGLRATYFDGRSSAARAVTVGCEAAQIVVRDEVGAVVQAAPLRACRLSEPLGRTGRTLRLPGGALCEVGDAAAVAALERCLGAGRGMRLVHALEARWRLAAAGVVALALGAAAVVAWGIPTAARAAAAALPPGVEEALGRRALEALDRGLFEPSRLAPERAASLRAVLARVAAAEEPGRAHRLALRRSPALGPNAFALPGGLVVLTDELVALAGSDRELAGALAHEVSHGRRRHALRAVLQNAGVVLLASALLGDVASLSSVAAALPPLLVRTGYSREFEREADEDAGRYLLAETGTTKPLRDLLARLEDRRADLPAASLLSTHPGLGERVARLRALEDGARRRR